MRSNALCCKGELPRFPNSAKFSVERMEEIFCVNLSAEPCVVLTLCVRIILNYKTQLYDTLLIY